MYNIKVIHYLNGEKEIRVFKRPVYEKGDIKVKFDLKKDVKRIEKMCRSDFGYFWEYVLLRCVGLKDLIFISLIYLNLKIVFKGFNMFFGAGAFMNLLN